MFRNLITALFLLTPVTVQAQHWNAGASWQGGLYPLFHVDGEARYEGAYMQGFAVHAEHHLANRVHVGGEVQTLWIMSEYAKSPRLTISPMARGRYTHPLFKHLSLDLILAVGATCWPEERDYGMGIAINMDQTQWGVSFRLSGGVRLALPRGVAIWFHGGYTALSTFTGGHTVYLDALSLSAGLGYTF